MKAPRIFGVILTALALALAAGCGGGDDNKAATTPTQTTPATAAATSSVKLDEYEFKPSDVVVKSSDSITVGNDGKIVHNLTVEKGPDPKKKSQKLAGTPTFAPGKSERLEVDLAPGKYVMVCTVAGHRELGMTGTFTVK
jgi:nitrite reductase (NO-forming)